jgi:hypothetical protein
VQIAANVTYNPNNITAQWTTTESVIMYKVKDSYWGTKAARDDKASRHPFAKYKVSASQEFCLDCKEEWTSKLGGFERQTVTFVEKSEKQGRTVLVEQMKQELLRRVTRDGWENNLIAQTSLGAA